MSSLDGGEGATAGEQMHLLQLSYWAQEVWQRMQVENHVSNHHQQPNFSNHHHQQPSNRLFGSNFVFLPFDHLSAKRMLPQGSIEYHERWRQSWYLPGLSGNFMYYALFLRTSKCREIPDFCSIFLPQIVVWMEMALRMSAQFNFDCLGHKEFKYSICHIVCAYNGLWELCTVTWSDGTRWTPQTVTTTRAPAVLIKHCMFIHMRHTNHFGS